MRNKQKDCFEIGIECEVIHYETNIPLFDLLYNIDRIVKSEKFTHIIIQKPLPPHLERFWQTIVSCIPPDMDIDGLTKDSKYSPCTPYGIMKYLEVCGVRLDGAHVVIIGRSDLVGKPLAKMMTDANATVTLCHSHTKYLQDFTKNADIVIVAVGKAEIFNAAWAPNAQIIVDVGINFNEEGKMVGDVKNVTNTERVTPVPGGVGLLTRWALLDQMINELP